MQTPLDIFRKNWSKARSVADPSANYCTLSTVSSTGEVSARTLVLREVDDTSFVVFINSKSPKWGELAYSQKFELLVFWPSLMQQYRVRGQISEIPFEKMKANWHKKPYDSKIIDYYYLSRNAQSSIVESREKLISGIEEVKKANPEEIKLHCPENVKGVSIEATRIEMWFNSPSDRIHDRQLATCNQNGEWTIKTMVP